MKLIRKRSKRSFDQDHGNIQSPPHPPAEEGFPCGRYSRPVGRRNGQGCEGPRNNCCLNEVPRTWCERNLAVSKLWLSVGGLRQHHAVSLHLLNRSLLSLRSRRNRSPHPFKGSRHWNHRYLAIWAIRSDLLGFSFLCLDQAAKRSQSLKWKHNICHAAITEITTALQCGSRRSQRSREHNFRRE